MVKYLAPQLFRVINIKDGSPLPTITSKTLASGSTVLNMTVVPFNSYDDEPPSWIQVAIWGPKGETTFEHNDIVLFGGALKEQPDDKGILRLKMDVDTTMPMHKVTVHRWKELSPSKETLPDTSSAPAASTESAADVDDIPF